MVNLEEHWSAQNPVLGQWALQDLGIEQNLCELREIYNKALSALISVEEDEVERLFGTQSRCLTLGVESLPKQGVPYTSSRWLGQKCLILFQVAKGQESSSTYIQGGKAINRLHILVVITQVLHWILGCWKISQHVPIPLSLVLHVWFNVDDWILELIIVLVLQPFFPVETVVHGTVQLTPGAKKSTACQSHHFHLIMKDEQRHWSPKESGIVYLLRWMYHFVEDSSTPPSHWEETVKTVFQHASKRFDWSTSELQIVPHMHLYQAIGQRH